MGVRCGTTTLIFFTSTGGGGISPTNSIGTWLAPARGPHCRGTSFLNRRPRGISFCWHHRSSRPHWCCTRGQPAELRIRRKRIGGIIDERKAHEERVRTPLQLLHLDAKARLVQEP